MGPEWEGDTRVLPRVIRTRFGPSVLPLRLMREGVSWDAAKAVGVAHSSRQPQRDLSVPVHVASGRLKKYFLFRRLTNNPSLPIATRPSRGEGSFGRMRAERLSVI